MMEKKSEHETTCEYFIYEEPTKYVQCGNCGFSVDGGTESVKGWLFCPHCGAFIERITE